MVSQEKYDSDVGYLLHRCNLLKMTPTMTQEYNFCGRVWDYHRSGFVEAEARQRAFQDIML
jgi:hypothetical protein